MDAIELANNLIKNYVFNKKKKNLFLTPYIAMKFGYFGWWDKGVARKAQIIEMIRTRNKSMDN